MKKYQVFISSTYDDLKEDRASIINILLEADCIPAGMEAFSATDDEQFNVIKRVIDLCDYYILIIGNRYGSINEETGNSYTQMEYEYAREKKIPVLVFSLNNPSYPSDGDDEKKMKLESFRKAAMKNRLAKICKDRVALCSSIALSIKKIIEDQPRPGWVRAVNSISAEQMNSKRSTSFDTFATPAYKSKKKSNPSQFRVILQYNNEPIEGASVVLVSENATCIDGKTNNAGVVVLPISTTHQYSLLITHPVFPSYIINELDVSSDLQISLTNRDLYGSLICHDTCHLPGLSGRLNIILDAENRTYLYADNISLDGQTLQPFSFKLNHPFTLEDCHGNIFEVIVTFIHGRTSILNYKKLN